MEQEADKIVLHKVRVRAQREVFEKEGCPFLYCKVLRDEAAHTARAPAVNGSQGQVPYRTDPRLPAL